MSAGPVQPPDAASARSGGPGSRRAVTAAMVGAALVFVAFLLARDALFPSRLVAPAGETASGRMWAPPEGGVTVLFHQRPPYYYKTRDGQVDGLCATPVRRALARAGLAVRWVEMPPARQLVVLREDAPRVAGLGWFRLPERERFAKFSAPVHRDRPLVALTFLEEARFPDGRPAAELLPGLPFRLLVRRGYSYGVWMDRLIARCKLPPVETDLVNRDMIRLLRRGRADYFFTAEEEARHLLSDAGVVGTGLRMVRFTDAPPGPTRHLMFSRATPDALIHRVDAGLPAVRGRPSSPSGHSSTLTSEAP